MTNYYARTEVTYSGGDKVFSITFPYINKSHIEVFVNDEKTTNFVFNTDSQIQINDALENGDTIIIVRNTPLTDRMVVFSDTSILNKDVQNLDSTQVFNVVQETEDKNNVFKQDLLDAVDDKMDTYMDVMNSYLDDINAVSNGMYDVAVIATNIGKVSAVVDSMEDIESLLDVKVDISNVSHNMPKVQSVANKLSDISAVKDGLSNISDVKYALPDIAIVKNNLNQIDTVARQMGKVVSVADNSTNINTVAQNKDDVRAVGSRMSAVLSVSDRLTPIVNVSNKLTEIGTVATGMSNIVIANTNMSNTNAVATNISNVNSVAGALTDIADVASDLTNINAVAGDLTNIDAAVDSASLAKDWANKTTDTVDGTEYSAKYYALQAANAHTVDQHYDKGSVNAQAGVAVAEAVSGKQDTLYTTDTIDIVEGLKVSVSNTNPFNDLTYKVTYGIVYNGTNFVGINAKGYVSTTTDGVTWTTPEQKLPTGTDWMFLAYGNNKYMAMSSNGTYTVSSDLTTWSTPATITGNKTWCKLVFGNNNFVALSTDNYVAYTSDNGSNWSTTQVMSGSSSDQNKLAYCNGVFIATSYWEMKAYYSTNLTTWTEITDSYAGSISMCESIFTYKNKFYVNSGMIYGSVITSDDGINFEEVPCIDVDEENPYKSISNIYATDNNIVLSSIFQNNTITKAVGVPVIKAADKTLINRNYGTSTDSIAVTNSSSAPFNYAYSTCFGYNSSFSALNATAYGYYSSVSGNNGSAFGSFASASNTYGSAFGAGAKATKNGAIQIGYGTNSTANSLSVGFWNSSSTHYNYKLLDGTTGYIPNERLLGLLDALFPVGARYSGSMSTCPIAALGVGTWTSIATGTWERTA